MRFSIASLALVLSLLFFVPVAPILGVILGIWALLKGPNDTKKIAFAAGLIGCVTSVISVVFFIMIVPSFFGGTFEKMSGIATSLTEEEMRILEGSNQQVTFLNTEWTIDSGATTTNFALHNNNDREVTYNIRSGFGCAITDGINFNTYDTILIDANRSMIVPLSIEPRSGLNGNFVCGFDLVEAGDTKIITSNRFSVIVK